MIYQQQRMSSIPTHAHGVLTFKLTRTRSESLSRSLSQKYGQHKTDVTKGRDPAL